MENNIRIILKRMVYDNHEMIASIAYVYNYYMITGGKEPYLACFIL